MPGLGGWQRWWQSKMPTRLMRAISDRESERRAIEQLLWGSTSGSVQAALADVREFALKQLHQIRATPHARPDAAWFELSRRIDSGSLMNRQIGLQVTCHLGPSARETS